MKPVFEKPFTQQEAISESVIERIGEILRSGRLHRYNTLEDEEAEATLLEREYAAWQGTKYCLACTSGGYALQLAMRASGLEQGDTVLANAYTLAPVPGAIHAAGGKPVFVEIGDDYRFCYLGPRGTWTPLHRASVPDTCPSVHDTRPGRARVCLARAP